jgi:hypothetical protein
LEGPRAGGNVLHPREMFVEFTHPSRVEPTGGPPRSWGCWVGPHKSCGPAVGFSARKRTFARRVAFIRPK